MDKILVALDKVATVLTVYGIETNKPKLQKLKLNEKVATVLTVYGIETICKCLI